MDQHNLLYPPIPLDDVKANNQVLYMHSVSLNDVFPTIFDVNSQVQEKLDAVFTEEIPALLDSDRCLNLKAAFLMLGDIRCIDRPKSDELRQMVSEEFRKHRIPLFIGNYEVFIATSLLVAADIESKPKETVLGLFVSEYRVSVYELYRESDGYILINRRFVRTDEIKTVPKVCGSAVAKLDAELTLANLKTFMLGKSNPKCVVIAHSNGSKILVLPHLTQLFHSKKIIEVELKDDKLVAALTKNMFDPTFNKFYVIPVSDDCLAVTKKDHDIGEQDSTISAKQYTTLPFKKSEVVPISSRPYFLFRWPTCSHDESNNCEFVTKYESVNGKAHRTKLTLIIDKNSFSYLYQEPYNIRQVEALPQTLISQPDLDVQVIGFFDNSSVICVRDENGYNFLESWNGKFGNDLFLSFKQEKVKLITDINDINIKDSSMVYDLVKILLMPFEKIEINPEWGFKVISDAKKNTLIEFDNFEGKQKSMNPVSLMSLLLKHHIEAIKDETGKKPAKLGFYVMDKLDKNVKKRFEKRLNEACKLSSIGCSFVKKF